MRKSTHKTKQRNSILSRNAYRRISRKKKGSYKRVTKPRVTRQDEIQCPEVFSLDMNFDAVVSTLTRIRAQSKINKESHTDQVFIHLHTIQEISPAAALVLVAEIYYWVRLGKSRRLKANDLSEWNPKVRKQMDDMGFFGLLGISSHERENTDNKDIRYLKFRTGKKSEGEKIAKLMDELQLLVGEMPHAPRLYNAVTEAMTNVRQHAYPHEQIVSNWWLTASHHKVKGELKILIYDQGIGIPKTLPKMLTQDVVSTLRRNHAGLIEKAHNLDRSASKEDHRGNGLAEMIEYLSKLNCSGSYRVVSLYGEYLFKKTESKQSVRKNNHNVPLRGTLIEWDVKLAND